MNFMTTRHYLLALLTLTQLSYTTAITIERLTPPIINDTTFTKVTCDRPKRTSGITTRVDIIDGKTIINCHGHGGSGYVALFGSVNEAVAHFMATNHDIGSPVRVIGSGVIGLTMALELYARGFTNISISTKQIHDIPSWRAGGFFDPGTGKEKTDQEKYFLTLALSTFETYRTIEQGAHPYLTSSTVRRLPLYCRGDIESGVEILETLGYMPASEKVTLDFGNGVTHENFVKYYTYFIDITLLMQQLWAHVRACNIPVVIEEITSLAQCAEPIICNCAGIASGTFTADSAMFPSRGHFFMLNAGAGTEHMNYSIFTEVTQNGKTEYVYLFPKNALVTAHNPTGDECRGMLGGTFCLHTNRLSTEESTALDQREFDKLSERTQQFFYGKK